MVVELAALEELVAAGEVPVDVWEDAVEVDDLWGEIVFGVGLAKRGDVVGTGDDAVGLDVAHFGEGAVDGVHQGGDFVQAGFFGGREEHLFWNGHDGCFT